MVLIPIQRLSSSTANVVSAPTKVAAVTSLLSGGVPNTVNVGNAPKIWPQLAKFDNDNSVFAGVPNPQFLWSQPVPVPGETRGFAVASAPVLLTLGLFNEFLINMTVFADNAVTARIDGINLIGITLIPIPGLNVDLVAGSNNPATGLTTDIANPYNWQNVRFYSNIASLGIVTIAINMQFIFSFEVTNYFTTGAVNTAGLAFNADIYQNLI